jgi:hypothetical protein
MPILEAVSETPDPHPTDALAPADASVPDEAAPADGSDSADGRPGSRAGRIVAVVIMSALVGAATFILMAVGESF